MISEKVIKYTTKISPPDLLSSTDFEIQILRPAITQFEGDPISLLHAFTAVWAVDSYASHVAWEKVDDTIQDLDRKALRDLETQFKNSVEESSSLHGWKFRVIRNLSNATKHAFRVPSKSNVVHESSSTMVQNRIGFAWYFQNSKYWGEQIEVDLDLELPEIDGRQAKHWIDNRGREYPGLLLKTIPVLDLLEPSIKLIKQAQ